MRNVSVLGIRLAARHPGAKRKAKLLVSALGQRPRRRTRRPRRSLARPWPRWSHSHEAAAGVRVLDNVIVG